MCTRYLIMFLYNITTKKNLKRCFPKNKQQNLLSFKGYIDSHVKMLTVPLNLMSMWFLENTSGLELTNN